MSMIRAIVRAELSALGENDVRVVMTTSAPARDGHVLVPAGCVLENYRLNPIMLWQHNPAFPVATADDIQIGPAGITATAHFAPAGVSKIADEVRGLVKAGVVRAVSVGFEPIEFEPLDPKAPAGGQRITKWELLECSFVSVPADVGAQVTERMLRSALPSPIKPVRKENAMAKSGSGTPRNVKLTFKRDLYDVGTLASILQDLGWVQDCATWEKECEGDASKVPALLGEAMVGVGKALIAMTAEEVGELLAKAGAMPPPEGADAMPPDGERAQTRGWQRFAAGFHDFTAFPTEISALRRGIENILALVQPKNTRAADGNADDAAEEDDADAAKADDKTSDATSDDKSDGAKADDDDAGDDNAGDDEDARAYADFRRRQADLLRLSAAP